MRMILTVSIMLLFPCALLAGDIGSSRIEGLSCTLTVKRTQKTVSSSFVQLEKGHRAIGVDVVIENNGNEDVKVSGLWFVVQDAEGFVYNEMVFSADLSPGFPSTTLRKGNKARGWVTFSVPKKTELQSLQLKYENGDNASDWIGLQ